MCRRDSTPGAHFVLVSSKQNPADIPIALLLAVAVAGCGSSETVDDSVDFEPPETTVEYTTVVTGAPTETIQDLLEQSLLLYRRQEGGAQSLAFLRRRATGDIETTQKILRSFGYYGAKVETKVDLIDPGSVESQETGDEPASDSATGTTAGTGESGDEPEQPELDVAVAEVLIDAGSQFVLSEHRVSLKDTDDDGVPELAPAKEFGSPVGEGAEAAKILSAENAMVARLRREGRPYARADGRSALADRSTATIEVETGISTGPEFAYGPIVFEGAPNVEDDYLLTYLPWEEGERIDAQQLSEYQRRLLSTQLFSAGRVSLPDEPPEGEEAPVTVFLEEAPRRSFRVKLEYNTDKGVGGAIGYRHRNLFGRNETFDLQADSTIDEQIATAKLTFPQFYRDGQRFGIQLQARRIEDDRYDELGGTFSAGIERKVSERWTVGAGGLIEYSIIDDTGIVEEEARLAGIPLFARYDGSNDLLDPTDGERFRFSITPMGGQWLDDTIGFVTLDGSASAYRPVAWDDRVVVASRGRLASIVGENLREVPPTRRLYSGGGGSVRGYQQYFVGPVDFLNSPIGGLSVVEMNGEVRSRVWGDLWLVGFVDAGSVSLDSVPSFEEGVQVAAGTGVRYASPIGPIRADLAFPINRRDVDNTFEFYISIGQAF